MHIPHTALACATLRNLVEEFVTREGTDYGQHSYSLQEKVQHVMKQLEQHKAVIVYDADTQSCHIRTSEQVGKPNEGREGES